MTRTRDELLIELLRLQQLRDSGRLNNDVYTRVDAAITTIRWALGYGDPSPSSNVIAGFH